MPDRTRRPDAPRLVCVGNLTVDEAVDAAGVGVTSVGGDALYAALAARLAGGRPRVLAPLGAADDDLAALHDALRTSGTDPDRLPRRAAPLVRNVVRYDAAGQRTWTLVHGEEHFAALSPTPDELAAVAADADGVLLSGMALDPQLALAAAAPTLTDAPVYFDPQEDYLAGHEPELRDAVARCDVFLPSEVEAVALAGTNDLRAAVRSFLALGPGVVVVKRAGAGCLVATTDRPDPVSVAAEPVEAVDATGAGDAFCGAFAVAHLRTGDPLAAARTAVRVAATAVRGAGVTPLLEAVRALGSDRPLTTGSRR
ncbi:ribokinase [Friedmanniella endophytica]|uniref:Ribokinase n=1 Tax=Microlunatus kandeliicorticis TaxID=1759536 RepID=A0A7W3P4J8_9ACTN|nr:carbohydrate kinase family protein [Microlunatus kandeliicorticis]MBA8792991.1 ribokinase [Microlunatus kandeliicorticis]